MNSIRTGIAAVMLITTMNGCISLPLYYSGQAIDTRVVDWDTGEPIPGVNAVAHWELKGGMEGGNIVGQQMILEAVSDENGRLFFPAWGPMPKKRGKLRTETSPAILLFKPGYDYTHRGNPGGFKFMDGPRLSTYWDGRVIKMKRFDGSLDDYGKKEIGGFKTPLGAIMRHDNYCGWKYIPHMLASLSNFCRKNTTCWLSPDMYIPNWEKSRRDSKDWYDRVTRQCGISPVTFFKEYYHE